MDLTWTVLVGPDLDCPVDPTWTNLVIGQYRPGTEDRMTFQPPRTGLTEKRGKTLMHSIKAARVGHLRHLILVHFLPAIEDRYTAKPYAVLSP